MKYEVLWLKNGHPKRPGKGIAVSSITIHNTGNAKSNARQERLWLDNPANDRNASWHIVVDEHGCIEAIPLNEMAWHAGSKANACSIGIELCESGDWQKTKANAILLCARLLRDHKLGPDALRRHKDWTGKICPRKLIPEWTAFVSAVAEQMKVLRRDDLWK